MFAKYIHQVLRQFPDCRFVYVLFRSRTLGYDIYPEDHFLRTFPWQQYGGLWIVDEARFARAGSLKTSTARALCSITGNGASTPTSHSDSPVSPFANDLSQQLPGTNRHMQDIARSQHPSSPHSLDSSINSFIGSTHYGGSSTTFEIQSPLSAISQPVATRPQLTLLTDVGRRYPGFPTPLSPTLSAKGFFPSPTSDSESWVVASRVTSPALRSLSPMSLDGSEMCGPSRRCNSHGYEHYASQMGLIDSVISQNTTSYGFVSPPPTPPFKPMSPATSTSPRSALLNNGFRKQSPTSARSPTPSLQYHPSTANAPGTITYAQVLPEQSVPVPSPRSRSLSLVRTMQIANGTVAELKSPYSLTGTILSYTSNRTVESGLLAVPPLNESRVAEYRFWVPCGLKTCAFGCGFAHEGEVAASKRLFQEVEEVKETDGGVGFVEDRAGVGGAKSPVMMDWAVFLKNREREGIAQF